MQFSVLFVAIILSVVIHAPPFCNKVLGIVTQVWSWHIGKHGRLTDCVFVSLVLLVSKDCTSPVANDMIILSSFLYTVDI